MVDNRATKPKFFYTMKFYSLNRSKSEYLKLLLKGMAMGAADIVPGVSGGTIAFITGIYEELLKSISSINFKIFSLLKEKNIKSAWYKINGNFLTCIFSGILFSVFFLSKTITFLIKSYPVLVWSFFFGLILASSFVIGRAIRSWNFQKVISLIFGAIIAYSITRLSPFENPESIFYIFISGAIAICAMVLPGISGSFILLLMGSYTIILRALNELNLTVLLVFSFGCLIGLLSFARLLSKFFKRYRDLTIAVLTGFLIGSINKVWPWKIIVLTRIDSNGEIVPFIEQSVMPNHFEGDPKILLALSLLAIGFLIVHVLNRLSTKN